MRISEVGLNVPSEWRVNERKYHSFASKTPQLTESINLCLQNIADEKSINRSQILVAERRGNST
uniref:Uncharacterized protein n=1 Tax=Kalanchoe fedtschenkoi TaxID=63787 RepID=A0A7N0ULW6_KALFE